MKANFLQNINPLLHHNYQCSTAGQGLMKEPKHAEFKFCKKKKKLPWNTQITSLAPHLKPFVALKNESCSHQTGNNECPLFLLVSVLWKACSVYLIMYVYVCLCVCAPAAPKQIWEPDSRGSPIFVYQCWQDANVACMQPTEACSHTGPHTDIRSYYCFCLWRRARGWNRRNYVCAVSVCVSVGLLLAPGASVKTRRFAFSTFTRWNGGKWKVGEHTLVHGALESMHSHSRRGASQVCGWGMIESQPCIW